MPGDRFASIDHFVQLCKERVDKFARIQTEQSIRLGYWMDWDRDEDWQKPPDERRSYFTMSEENNYTIWSFLKKCHERGLIYRGYDAMPWCPRCCRRPEPDGDGTRAISWSPTARCSCAFPLRGRPGENLLVWTTTPWTLTSNVAAAVNPELTYLKVQHKDQVYYLAKGAFTAHRLEEEFKTARRWVEGVPKLKTLEQIFKEKGGYEIVGEVKGADMVGWAYDGPFDELPAQQHPAGYPGRDRRRGARSRTGRRRSRRRRRTASSPGRTSARRRAPASSTSPPAAARRTSSSARTRACRRSRRWTNSASSCPASASWTGKSAVDPATTDWILDNLQAKGRPAGGGEVSAQLSALLALQDGAAVPAGGRVVHQHVVARRDQGGGASRAAGCRSRSTARPASWTGSRNMGDWMISKKRFWGLALPIWVDEQ